MFDHRVIRRMCSVLAALLLVPVAMAAPPAADRDTLEVNAYVLTEAAFTKYAQATKKLQAAPGRAADCDDDDDGGTDASIAAQVARLEALPGARAALQSAGLATREYVVISWSLLQAGIADGKIVPVFCGSAAKNIGINALLDNIVKLFPAPTFTSKR